MLKYRGQNRSVQLLALACWASVTRLLKLTPNIICFRGACGQNVAPWGKHHGFGEGVSLLEPWLVLVAEKTRELRSALPAAAPCELCRSWVGKPGDVGKPLLSPCS